MSGYVRTPFILPIRPKPGLDIDDPDQPFSRPSLAATKAAYERFGYQLSVIEAVYSESD